MNDICQLDTLNTAVHGASPDEDQQLTTGLQVPNLFGFVSRAIAWILKRTKTQHARKMLKVCESVSLGEKRFVAVVQVADERFLIGGASTSVSMLARLGSATFSDVLRSSQGAGR
jgi:flagellar biogenesis protein FliO